MSMLLSAGNRAAQVRAGVRIESVSIGWMIIEGAVALVAGILARSVLLTAFGLDSVIELVSGGILLWRLAVEASGGSLDRVASAERRAAWVTGIALVVLCAYIVGSVIVSFYAGAHSRQSTVGVALAVASLVIMPVLARSKRAIAAAIDSAALRGDAACSITCAYMAATLLVGLLLNAIFHWWWADSLGALGLLYWLSQEAREAIAGARQGRAACACGDDKCGAP